jgi:ComF family protein
MRDGPVSAALAIALKHRDQTYLAPALAPWLARAGSELLAEADLLVPVPLHWTRLVRRRYNQSALLASALARASGVAYRADILTRKRMTPSQAGLTRAQRIDNVAGAFAVPARLRPALAGKHVLLIDDVMTTGATAEACARNLLRGGAGQVDFLTLARVVASD